MTAADDIARLLFITDNDRASDPWGEWEYARQHPELTSYLYMMADAILAAGFRKPRTITTAEELDALPDGVLVLTEQGGYWESIKRMDRKNWWHEPGSTNVSPSEYLTLPATVLHEGAQS